MENIKVLIAEDEQDLLKIMVQIVKDADYSVITAKDGEETWDKIQREHPDIVLLDLTMPKLDGYEVLKKLRQDPPTRKWIPVIIVSASGAIEDMQKTFELEAKHYIVKPFKSHDILKGIKLMASLIDQRINKTGDCHL